MCPTLTSGTGDPPEGASRRRIKAVESLPAGEPEVGTRSGQSQRSATLAAAGGRDQDKVGRPLQRPPRPAVARFVTSLWLKYRGTRFPIRQGESVLGRSPYCTIVLSNGLASRRHCLLTHEGDKLTIQDLGSSNGTTVNGQRISAASSLSVGDVILVGTDLLEVVAGERHERRGKTRTARIVGPDELGAEQTATNVDANTLELVESLAAGASQMRDPHGIGETIQRAVDALVQTRVERKERFDRASAARLRAIIERVVRWAPDRSLEAWRRTTIETISRWEAG